MVIEFDEEHAIVARQAFENMVLGMRMVIPPVFAAEADDGFARDAVVHSYRQVMRVRILSGRAPRPLTVSRVALMVAP